MEIELLDMKYAYTTINENEQNFQAFGDHHLTALPLSFCDSSQLLYKALSIFLSTSLLLLAFP